MDTAIKNNQMPTFMRFWRRIRFDRDCWHWIGARSRKGYGRLHVNGRLTVAHRYAYTHMVGSIPDDLTVDHLCRNRLCINPAHMEIVPNRVNVLRGIGPTAVNARKTECSRGHALDEKNTYVNPTTGWRNCRACKRISDHKRRAG